MATGKCVATLEGHSGGVRGVAVFPDGRRVVSGSHDKTLKLWGENVDISNLAEPRTPRGHSDAHPRPAGFRLTRFQQLTRGTRVRVVDDRQAVLAAFEAQDDVLGQPDDWEASLGCDFIVEGCDSNDETYVLVKPDAYDEKSPNIKDGTWWPYSVILLLG